MKMGTPSTGSAAPAKPALLFAALVVLTAGIALSGCGSSSGSGSSSNEGGEAGGPTTTGVAESEDTGAETDGTLVPAPPTTPPAEIAITEPLPGTPPKGKEVIFLQCEVASCERFSGAMEEAAAAIGWKARIMPLNNNNPGA